MKFEGRNDGPVDNAGEAIAVGPIDTVAFRFEGGDGMEMEFFNPV